MLVVVVVGAVPKPPCAPWPGAVVDRRGAVDPLLARLCSDSGVVMMMMTTTARGMERPDEWPS